MSAIPASSSPASTVPASTSPAGTVPASTSPAGTPPAAAGTASSTSAASIAAPGVTGPPDDLLHRIAVAAERAYASFNQRFWNPSAEQLFDVVDGEHGDDPACRPNQIFAISLAHPVLAPEHFAPVFAAVEHQLLTPVGLRSLARAHPDYKPTYDGDLLTRDAAYHQGTVWSWLIGPYVDAALRVHPNDLARARRALDGLIAHLGENCIGFVGEVFDAEPPFSPGGCVAQAWGVAELLRCLLRLAPT